MAGEIGHQAFLVVLAYSNFQDSDLPAEPIDTKHLNDAWQRMGYMRTKLESDMQRYLGLDELGLVVKDALEAAHDKLRKPPPGPAP
jgi:hypothetical protein